MNDSFLLSLDFINTANATPLPVNSPPIAVPKVIIPLKYNSVIITDAAQFGISPNKLVRIGANIEFEKKIFSIILLGTYSNNKFKINVIINIKTNVFNVHHQKN